RTDPFREDLSAFGVRRFPTISCAVVAHGPDFATFGERVELAKRPGGPTTTVKTGRETMRKAIHAALPALAFGFVATASAQPPEPPQPCQRACLEGFVDNYLQAMADGSVDPALFAPTARFTENGIELPLGNEGLWATASGVGNYKFYVPDVE